MSEERHETLADIVAEMRADFRKRRDEWGDYYTDKFFGHCNFPGWLDRIEAAAEREREIHADELSAVGVMAAIDGARRNAEAVAHSAPPRNCDVYRTAEEASDAWQELDNEDDGALEPFDWLYAPYEYRTPAPALDVVMANPEMKIAKEV